MPFGNMLGLYALLALIPFIIIYLIRPRLKEKIIPSLMFLLKETTSAKQTAFLQKLIKNLIFLMQLAMILLLAFSAAQPYIMSSKNVNDENTVLVIDVSGSSQASSGMTTRFNKEIEEAMNNMKGRVSIILAAETPSIVIEDARIFDAKNALASVRAKATMSNIGDAMILAGDTLGSKKGTIVVLSDFISNLGSDVLTTKQMLISKGYNVKFIDVSSEAKNAGIIDANFDKLKTKVYVKNYDNDTKPIVLRIIQNNIEIHRETKNVPGNSLEMFVYDTPADISRAVINDDDFNLDNSFYLNAAGKKNISVWLITSLKEGATPYENEKPKYLVYDYLYNALKSMGDINLHVAKSPIVEQSTGLEKINEVNPEIIIIHKLDQQLLPGSANIIKKLLEKGSFLIVDSQPDIAAMGLEDLLIVKVEGLGNRTEITKTIDNEVTSDVEFSPVAKYLKVKADENAIALAETANDKTPILLQKGNIIYYGVDDSAGFKTTASYPILWSNMIASAVKTENMDDYNIKSGKIIPFSAETVVTTPSGRIRTQHLIFDEAGIYEVEGKKIAVNMLSEEESNVNKQNVLTEGQDIGSGKAQQQEKVDFEVSFIIIVLLILFAEIVLLKIRGDL